MLLFSSATLSVDLIKIPCVEKMFKLNEIFMNKNSFVYIQEISTVDSCVVVYLCWFITWKTLLGDVKAQSFNFRMQCWLLWLFYDVVVFSGEFAFRVVLHPYMWYFISSCWGMLKCVMIFWLIKIWRKLSNEFLKTLSTAWKLLYIINFRISLIFFYYRIMYSIFLLSLTSSIIYMNSVFFFFITIMFFS
jgi:hypothetical protein